MTRVRTIGCVACLLACAGRAFGFLGVADTSFVTVIANPAEAANWASQLERMTSQLAAANATLATVSQLKAYAGDPRLAAASVPELAEVSAALGTLASGGQTEADLVQAWQASGSSGRLLGEAAILASAGEGATMQVFGSTVQRNAALYAGLASKAGVTGALRGQIAGEQSARRRVSDELALAWERFRAAPDETSKQATLAEITQLQSQDQVLDARRRAIVDDLALSDRQDRAAADARSLATDEQLLAESAELEAAESSRAAGADAARRATLSKGAAAPASQDYSSLRTWTPADSGGSP